MPVQGFKVGDRVLTPSGREATVTAVRADRVMVTVRYETGPFHNRAFRAAALRFASVPAIPKEG